MESLSFYDKLYKAFLYDKEEVIHTFFSNEKNKSASGRLLHIALRSGHRSFFEYLLEHIADVNWKNSNGRTLLEVAIQNKDSDSVKSLLNHGADINVSTKIYVLGLKYVDGTLLHTAVQYDNVEIVKLLLEKGMDVNRRIRPYEMRKDDSDLLVTKTQLSYRDRSNCLHFDENGSFRKPQLTLLQVAVVVQRNDNFVQSNVQEEIVELLLENGATLDDETNQIHTLHLAIMHNANLFVIEKLIEYGANINSVCKNQYTPLSHAVEYREKKIILYLLKRGAIFNVNSINSVFHNFLLRHNIFCEKLFAFMIDSSADINSKNEIGDTPLQHVVRKCLHFNNEVQLLLDYGSNINVQDEHGNTPLHFAVHSDNLKDVLILLEYEANHTFLNAKGQTPLMILNEKRNMAPSKYKPIKYNRMESIITSDISYCCLLGGKFSRYEKIVCFLVRTIVTNAESGKHVNEDDLHFVKTTLRVCYDKFKNELEKAKLKKARGNIYYYDFLTKSISVLETCVNKSVLENIASSEVEKEFPLYGDMIRMRIMRIKERQILVEFCVKRFKNLFHLEDDPPTLVTEKLMSYLSSVDLITLWRVFKRKGEYLSKFLNRPEGMKLLELNE